ncbi:MAG: hypothetical protein H7A36_05705 [Chlamydiales bacterium]|nr:hypothetical protein [Chlamydiales bacterium]
MKRLLIFATLVEAKATIEALNAFPAGDLYAFENGLIAICGIGIHQAQACTSRYAQECDEVWNLGFAGALSSLPMHEIVSISKVGKYVPIIDLDPHSKEMMLNTLPTFELGGSVPLISSDFPIHSKIHRPENFALVDMEGYGIAFAANALQKPLRMWKIVSDFASPEGIALIKKHKTQLSQLLAQKVLDGIVKFSPL